MFIEIRRNILNYFQRLTENRKLLLRIILIVIVLIAAFIIRSNNSSKDKIKIEDSTPEKKQVSYIYVDIDGAVEHPGVYKFESDTRLYQVIEEAGGLKSSADTSSINRADFVEDGQKIIIPSLLDTGSENDSEASVSSSNSSNGLININTATKEDLMNITGVGEVIAERIIDYRKTNRFNSIEDIMCVKGIGTATFEKMKSEITV